MWLIHLQRSSWFRFRDGNPQASRCPRVIDQGPPNLLIPQCAWEVGNPAQGVGLHGPTQAGTLQWNDGEGGQRPWGPRVQMHKPISRGRAS
jgi:hypothetical protein